jgi:UDP-2,3-diacylglucosamine pyrophosphatase LpxH
MLEFDTVVVSDLHLGARNSRTEDILRFLDVLKTDRLVIAGDLFESPVLWGLNSRDLRVLQVLRQFAREKELVWLRGNHDPDDDWCRDVLELPIQDELLINVDQRTYLISHGHLWDRSPPLPQIVIEGAELVYHVSQRVDKSHRLARWLKQKSKLFCRAVEGLRRAALEEVQSRRLDGVIVGHSHVAGDNRFEGLHYLNCGCWTELPTGYVGIRADSVHQFAWCPPAPAWAPTASASASRAAGTPRPPLAICSGEGS